MKIGSFTFVLHSHIPYTRKAGMWPFGEEWLYEAASESYIPLLDILNELVEEGISPKITIGFTPVLVEQLTDKYMNDRFERYLFHKIDTCAKEMERFQDNRDFRRLARFYEEYYTRILNSYEDNYSKNIISGFSELQDNGHIEIITSAATHGYLPLLSTDSAVRAQIHIGVQSYERHFKRRPRGIWLPECGYRPTSKWKNPITGVVKERPGLEKFLIEEMLDYFIVDYQTLCGKGKYHNIFPMQGQSIKENDVISKELELEYSTFNPYQILYNGSKITVLGRNEETAIQVWSGEWGYPGDGWYREFHKKDHLSGLQYWRVTSKEKDLSTKKPYVPEAAESRIEENSEHFANLILDILTNFRNKTGEHGIVVAAYDTELFGHWWFEGPKWIKSTIKKLKGLGIEVTTCSQFISEHPAVKNITISESSWGNDRVHRIWQNVGTNWMWKKIYDSEERMEIVASKYIDADGEKAQMLAQAARELLLMESSDWTFLTTTMQAVEYSAGRLNEHYARFNEILDALEKGEKIDIERMMEKDNIFPNLDFRVYAKREEKKNAE
ncbi:MAG: glycoside hydrolase family 57 protein [Thermoplasmata archaeon]